MIWFLLAVATAGIYWGVSQSRSRKAAQAKLQDYSQRYQEAQDRLQDYAQRYQPAMIIDRYVQLGEDKVQSLLGKEQQLRAEIQAAEEDLSRINEELALATDAAFLAEIGYYEPRYDFQDIASYEAELQRIRGRAH